VRGGTGAQVLCEGKKGGIRGRKPKGRGIVYTAGFGGDASPNAGISLGKDKNFLLLSLD
jgi:hypothetical protein